ncbi:uncharacterized protein LOC135144276 [Zophobas morio]|uniref:uncharacterized protein LOC135144276 n=1 Tax=Zophobas morio TaxID=2755281 RepID=UPI003082C611
MKSNIANVRMPLGDIKNKTEEKENPIKKPVTNKNVHVHDTDIQAKKNSEFKNTFESQKILIEKYLNEIAELKETIKDLKTSLDIYKRSHKENLTELTDLQAICEMACKENDVLHKELENKEKEISLLKSELSYFLLIKDAQTEENEESSKQ